MCVGGGGGSVPAARITDPLQGTKQYKQATQRVQRVKSRKGQMDPATYKEKLGNARQQRKAVKNKYKDPRANRVENDNQQLLQQDAMRQSLLKGAPPPEDSADRPVVGRFRDENYRPGQTRQALRIDRTPSSTLTI